MLKLAGVIIELPSNQLADLINSTRSLASPTIPS